MRHLIPPASARVVASPEERLRRARAFIDRSYDLPLDLNQIAGQAHFSRFHFIRLFHRAFGQTPHQYLIRRRVDRARELLAGSQLSVLEVCLAVGFQSLGSFSTLFRRQVGCAPHQYRAAARRSRRAHPFVPACFLTMAGLQPPDPA